MPYWDWINQLNWSSWQTGLEAPSKAQKKATDLSQRGEPWMIHEMDELFHMDASFLTSHAEVLETRSTTRKPLEGWQRPFSFVLLLASEKLGKRTCLCHEFLWNLLKRSKFHGLHLTFTLFIIGHTLLARFLIIRHSQDVPVKFCFIDMQRIFPFEWISSMWPPFHPAPCRHGWPQNCSPSPSSDPAGYGLDV